MLKFVICLLIVGSVANAQEQPQPCKPIEVMHRALWERYHERPIAIGDGQKGMRFEITSNPFDVGTWTLLGIKPDGMACMLASGDQWAPILWGAPSQ